MELLRELTRIQHEQGYLSDEVLRDLAALRGVPLYRLEGLASFYPLFRRTPAPKTVIQVCRDISCLMAGGDGCRRKLMDELSSHDDVLVEEVSCLGRCDAAPAAAINEIPLAPDTLADPEPVMEWIRSGPGLARNPTGAKLKCQCDPYGTAADHYSTVGSLLAPENFKAGGAADQRKALGKQCIERLNESRLRGMGGAGFPTGRKWELVASEAAQPKYVICNADESEPGTFKDRFILTNLPHLIVEGMLLAGLTIGAERGIIYLRHEYAPEKQSLELALKQARQLGVLGDNAAGSGQRFEIEIFVSPGGYILGEETALLEALEDKRGEPRNKPPYPGTHGLWGKPTLINNVETFALATSIVHFGSKWWHDQGCGECSGIKFFSISGDIARPGVYEIPIGTPVSRLIEMAGGMKQNKSLKAFLPGGASSNFLTPGHVHTPLDFDAMKKAGSMLGTGAVIVIADDQDLFGLATNLVQFFRNESCGKCVPCRIGSEQAVQLLNHVQLGETPPSELEVLNDLGETLEQTSICGLGQVALNPVLSMMKHFPNDVPS